MAKSRVLEKYLRGEVSSTAGHFFGADSVQHAGNGEVERGISQAGMGCPIANLRIRVEVQTAGDKTQ